MYFAYLTNLGTLELTKTNILNGDMGDGGLMRGGVFI